MLLLKSGYFLRVNASKRATLYSRSNSLRTVSLVVNHYPLIGARPIKLSQDRARLALHEKKKKIMDDDINDGTWPILTVSNFLESNSSRCTRFSSGEASVSSFIAYCESRSTPHKLLIIITPRCRNDDWFAPESLLARNMEMLWVVDINYNTNRSSRLRLENLEKISPSLFPEDRLSGNNSAVKLFQRFIFRSNRAYFRSVFVIFRILRIILFQMKCYSEKFEDENTTRFGSGKVCTLINR